MSDTIDSMYTTMERSEKAQTPNRKNQTIASVICIIVYIIGITFFLKREKDLKVACNFFSYSSLRMCTEAESLGNTMTLGMLSTIPSEIGLLTHTKYIWIEGESVVGTIPSTMGMLTKLKYLEIYNTQLTGTLPSTLGNMIQLKVLRINRNQKLTGIIPQRQKSWFPHHY